MVDAPKTTVAIALREAMPVRTVALSVVDAPAVSWQGEQGTIGTARDNSLVLNDETVSGYHVRFSALKHGIQVTDFGSTNGTWIGDVRIEKAVVPTGAVLRLGRTQVRLGPGLPETVELHHEDRLGEIRGRTASMRRLMRDLRQVAQSSVAVLVIGESGTGKELIARGIHDASPRRGRPFVTIDCGALTPTLVASEMFGHEQGAFTGASKLKRGAFEHADGGTLFLDEIGELPPELQATLLGALERKRFTRVGGNTEIAVDVRIVAATNRDLRADVNAEIFRLDLYYRLAVLTLEVPPLRARATDIPLLIEQFLRDEGSEAEVPQIIDDAMMQQLLRHRWPGNVRELKNFVQATLAMGSPVELRGDFSDPEGHEGELIAALDRFVELPYTNARASLLAAFEARYAHQLLDRNLGNVARAAREGQMARSHLNELIRRHGLRRGDYEGPVTK